MSGDKFNLEVVLSAHTQGAEKSERTLSILQDVVDALGRSGAVTQKELNKLSQTLNKVSSSKPNTSQWTASFAALRKEIQSTSDSLSKLAQTHVTRGGRNPLGAAAKTMSVEEARRILAVREASNLDAYSVADRVVRDDNRRIQAAKNLQAAEKAVVDAKREAARYDMSSLDAAKDRLSAAKEELSVIRSRKGGLSRGADTPERTQQRADVLQDEAAAIVKVARAQQDVNRELNKYNSTSQDSINRTISLRYANYDLATTMFAISGSIAAIGTSTVAAFASQERAFADVRRTLESGTVESVESLHSAFTKLSTEIPSSFNEISAIATLGNQLGVAEADLEAFTTTVAAFSAITGISADSASQAFGKLGNLLNVQVEDYDRLASSIALVGRTTAATEEQIISIASEIAPAAAAAGMSADAVIGLSGALGSLRVPPERSRSTILQFFETLNTAVAQGGDSLNNFATVVGVTASELDSMVRMGQGEEILTRFISNISVQDTVAVTQALQELGLAGLRTNPTIRALAGNMDLLTGAIQTGKQGFMENTELQRQMEIITGTLSAKFQMLLNALVNFAAQAGSALAPTLGRVLDILKDSLVALTDFLASPVGEVFTRTITVIAGAITVWAALRGAIALAHGSVLAFRLVTSALGGKGIISGLQGLAAAFLSTGTTAKHAAGSVLTLRGALLALGRATVIGAVFAYIAEWIFNTGEAAYNAGVAVGEFANFLLEVGQAINDFFGWGSASEDITYKAIRSWSEGLKNWGKSLQEQQANADDALTGVGNLASGVDDLANLFGGASNQANDFGDSLDGVGDSAQEAAQEVRTLVDYANDLRQVWDRAFEIRFSGQTTLDAITKTFLDLKEASAEASKKIRSLKADIQGLQSDIGLQEYFLSIAIEYGDTKRATAIEANLAKLRAELADKTDELKKAQDSNNKTLVGNSRAAIENRTTIQQLVQQYQAHIGALAASGMSSEELAIATERLRADFIRQATQLGYNRNELKKYEAAFNDVRVAISKVPRNITVKASADPAIQAFNEMNAAAQRANSSVGALRNSLGGGFGVGHANTYELDKVAYKAEKARLQQALLLEALKAPGWQRAMFPYTADGARSRVRQLSSWGYAYGGFTGRGGMYEPAGIVHKGEYVIPKRDVNQATGLPYADALGRLMTGLPSRSVAPASSGGASSGVTTVALTAGTIQAIAQATGKVLVLDGKIVADSSANVYRNQTVVGAY